jgi:hypothetical protein
MAQHDTGEPVVLYNSALFPLQFETGYIGSEAQLRVNTHGPDTIVGLLVEALNLKPYSPIDIEFDHVTGDDITFTWQNRTRFVDSSTFVMGEVTEKYEVDFLNDLGGVVHTITNLTSKQCTYTAAQQIIDFGEVQTSINVAVYQISATVGRGFAGRATIEVPAPPDLGYSALGAGAPGIDGDYPPDGTFGGRTRYVNIDYALAWWDDVDGTGWVLIDTAYLGGGSSYFDAYAFGPNALTPEGEYEISGLPGSYVTVTAI